MVDVNPTLTVFSIATKRETNAVGTSYVLLFASMLGLLIGIGLLVYGWPQPCGPFGIGPGPGIGPFGLCASSLLAAYSVVIFSIVVMAASVSLMTYSIRNNVH